MLLVALNLKSSLVKLVTTAVKLPAVVHFSTSSILLKKKKHFKYDPDFKHKKKESKKKKVGFDSISALDNSEIDKDLVKFSRTEMELEEQTNDKNVLDQKILLETLNRRKLHSPELITEDAEHGLNQLIQHFPKLAIIDKEELRKYLEFMTMYGFKPVQSAEMGILHSSILSNYESSVPKTVGVWRGFGYSEKDILTILHFYPQLIDISSLEIRTRFGFLTSYFTNQETMFAIVNNISIVYDNESIVKRKLEYLIKSVCHRTKIIAQSVALSFPFKHIKLRHELLIRAGLFQPDNYLQLHKKLYMINPKLPRDRYFPVSDVVCTSDKKFLRICTNDLLTLNELAAFEELFEKEQEREALLLSDDEEIFVEGEDDDEEKEMLLASTHGANHSSEFFNKKDAADFYY